MDRQAGLGGLGGVPARRGRRSISSGCSRLFGVAQSQNPEVWFLAFAISPQFYMFLETRLAMVLGIAVNFLAAALLVARYPSGTTAATAFGVAVAGGGFSVFYGAWVTRIIMQSAERAEIIDQLEATRAELAAAQHEAGRLAERQRLAADIHDTLAQGFTSILMLIQAAQADLGRTTRIRWRAGTWTWPSEPPGTTWPRRGRWWRTWRPRGSRAARCPTRCAGCRENTGRGGELRRVW